MEIRLNINDCKKIADNVKKTYTELEQCLARKMLASDHENARLKVENKELLDLLQVFYRKLTENKFTERMKAFRENQLNGNKNVIEPSNV